MFAFLRSIDFMQGHWHTHVFIQPVIRVSVFLRFLNYEDLEDNFPSYIDLMKSIVIIIQHRIWKKYVFIKWIDWQWAHIYSMRLIYLYSTFSRINWGSVFGYTSVCHPYYHLKTHVTKRYICIFGIWYICQEHYFVHFVFVHW